MAMALEQTPHTQKKLDAAIKAIVSMAKVSLR